MKKYIYFLLGFLLAVNLHAQSIPEKIAIRACDCLYSYDTYDQLKDSLKHCVSSATAYYMTNGPVEDQEYLKSFQGALKTLTEVFDMLPSNCYHLRHLMIEEKKKQYYTFSAISSANKHYEKGNDFIDKGDFSNSIMEFNEAIKIDNSFVNALDNLGLSYRCQGNYKEAVKSYRKSLEIFPEGDVALLNIAVAYSLLKDNKNSLKYYKELIFYYRDNPEGYFGCGKILFLKSDYENALENIFIAHKIYTQTNSEYLKDSETMIRLIYFEMKDKKKLDIFNEKAKKYNIIIAE